MSSITGMVQSHVELFCVCVCLFCLVSESGSLYLWPSLNSLCRTGWSQTERSTCLCSSFLRQGLQEPRLACNQSCFYLSSAGDGPRAPAVLTGRVRSTWASSSLWPLMRPCFKVLSPGLELTIQTRLVPADHELGLKNLTVALLTSLPTSPFLATATSDEASLAKCHGPLHPPAVSV